MNRSGVAVADHHQFVLGSPTAETYSPSETGSVIEVGPNFVTIRTGIAYGPVSLTVEVLDDEPTSDADQRKWEVVEEATLKVTKAFHVLRPGGEKQADFGKLPMRRGLHTFRVSGCGRDAHWDLTVEEPTEQYVVQAWRVVQPKRMTRLHKTDSAWDQDLVEHPVRKWWDPDPAADASMHLEFGYEQMAEWAKEEAIRWGGRPPSEKLRRRPQAIGIAGPDRALADAITRARLPKLLRMTTWAVRRALTIADIADRDWIAPALDALDDERPVPSPFGPNQVQELVRAVREDPTIETAVTEGGSAPPALIAIHGVREAAELLPLDPLQAAFKSLETAARTDEGDYDALIVDLRKMFFPKLMPVDQYERWI